MVESARPLTPRGMGTPRSPRMNEAATGAAAARPFVQRLRACGDEGDKILEVVKEAEKAHDNLYALSEIYGVAVEVYQKARNTEDNDLSDISVKRMRLLCRLSPSEAREFHNRLRAFTTGHVDARMYEARAAMEERLGDKAKAIKMLQEGLRVGAQPEEVLRRQLTKLQPSEPQLTPQKTGLSNGQGCVPTPPRSPRQASIPMVLQAQAPKQATPPRQVTPPVCLSQPGKLAFDAFFPFTGHTAKGAEASTPGSSALAAVKPVAQPVVSSTRPRSLGGLLGPPTRRLSGDDDLSDDEEDEDEAEDKEEQQEEDEEDMHVEDEEEADGDDAHLSATALTVPLSPIQEQDSLLEEASCESESSRASIPPPGSTAPTPQRALNACTPRSAQKHDLSIDSGNDHAAQPATPIQFSTRIHPATPIQPTPSGSGKSIFVNGVAYTKLHKIGQGGSSKVYMVRTPEGEEVALKRVETDCPKQFEGYQNEVDLLLRLKGQEHVIQVLDAEVERDHGRILIVMEAGEIDLHSYLNSQPRLSLVKLQNIWRQMLKGLQVIHNARIVHADLKPGNFVLVHGKLKVIDFGIAKRISVDTTNICHGGVGTLSYMAPEALKGGKLKIGRASDIWSLGIILFQMVYKRYPFPDLEPLQRMVQLSREDVRIEFPEDHCLALHSSATKAQLLDVLGSCLQRDSRRRPGIPHLLAHPFLRTSAEVERESLQGAVKSMMDNAVRLLGLGAPVQAPGSEEDRWQTLADEVWERVVDSRGSSSREAAGSFDGLAPVSAVALSLKRERDNALAEAERLKAHNVELESQLRRLQQPRGSVGNELKERGQLPRRQYRPEDLKENMGIC